MERPKLLRLSLEERKKSIDKLIEQSDPDQGFFLLLVLSAAIVVGGLLINDGAAIIGGMLVAPLLAPILTLSLGVVLSDFKLITRSLLTILAALAVIIFFSFLLALFSDINPQTHIQIVSRSHVSLAYLIIAIASGAAAAFALSKPDLSAALPGVAVSVALLPPLSVTGIGIAYWNWQLISGSLSLFAVNLIGIQFAALIVYSLMGLYPVRGQVEEKFEREKKEREIEEKIANEEKEIEKKLEQAEAEEEERLEKEMEKLEKKEERMKKEAGLETDEEDAGSSGA